MAEGKKEMVWKLTEEDMQLGFEEAMPLMPSQVVAEACDSNFFCPTHFVFFFFFFFFL